MFQTLTVLVSVYNKSGLITLLNRLAKSYQLKIISTTGTAKYLSKAGFKVREVAELTGFPEILNGRVKTLHPKIFGGILADKNNQEHLRELKHFGIGPIDMVVVNLYPFAKTIKRPGVRLEEALEQIDIGGVSLIRAAAKSYRTTIVASRVKDYPLLTTELSLKQRRSLAGKAFQLTSQYDRLIARYLNYER